ncbi:nitroreductase family protein [Coleofasciculus chthonoplastes]|uniref:nitroreductase family protein n=1 Tax=Coleofasciculus chthonoplastes TaxID=64178 RepID=UPI0032FFBBA4
MISFLKRLTAILDQKIIERLKLAAVVPAAMAWPQLTFNYVYDLKRFLSLSAVNKRDTQTKLRALITMDYHRIEKGLALKAPRVGFGSGVVQRLLAYLHKYQENYGFDETAQTALNVLFTYYNFNLEQGLKNEQLYQALITLKDTITDPESTTRKGGVIKVSKQSIHRAAKLDLQNFFVHRYSIRQFAPEEVDMSLIEKAVLMAQKTPSVCNRQSSKVYVYNSDQDKQKALSYQNGNRGFGDQVNKLLIVTSDLEHFVSIGERNQCWIDGGMFAMSLVYALHSLGLGTCCLNWSVEHQRDKQLREAMEIRNSESIIMMIAVGHLPEQLTVAQSSRKNIREVMIFK